MLSGYSRRVEQLQQGLSGLRSLIYQDALPKKLTDFWTGWDILASLITFIPSGTTSFMFKKDFHSALNSAWNMVDMP